MNEEITKWLIEHKALMLMMLKGDRVKLTIYNVNAHLFIVREWPDEEGWDVFIPAHEGNSVKETIKALERYVTGKGA